MSNYRPKVLVLDEDPLALELYSRELGLDYEVVTSSSVSESIDYLSIYEPDVLVIEPATDNNCGWQVLQAASSMQDPPNMILCSTQDDRPRSPCDGIDWFLVKPVLPVTLHTLVDQIVAKRFFHLHQRLDQD